MKSKKQQLLEYINAGYTDSALAIAKNFVIEFSKDDQRTLQIAHESQSKQRAVFYKSIGVDVEFIKREAITILENYALRFG
jgi:hypothetical protein